MATTGPGLLIFDGDCSFCTLAAQWVAEAWPSGPTTIAWQQLGPKALRDLGITVEQAQQAAWWVDDAGGRFRGHRAIAKSLVPCGGWKRVAGGVISAPPLSWVAAAVYWLVVRYRYRLPGGTPGCAIQPPKVRGSTGAR